MGKDTDKSYITHSEWTNDFGGAKQHQQQEFKALPFHCCSLSLQPVQHPVCTAKGTVYDLLYILPWIKQFQTDPVTGEPLSAKSLITLHFHKNSLGDYHCPVTFKVFTPHSHIVAIKNTGNVYAWDTIQTLNIKPKHFNDLITDEPFTRKDIITIQDPNDLKSRDRTSFHYFKNNLKLDKPPDKLSDKINYTGTASRILKEMAATGSKTPKFSFEAQEKIPISNSHTAHFSSGRTAASLTSTVMEIVTKTESALIEKAEFLIQNVKGRGQATFETNLGSIKVELYVSEAPRTCYNLITLAKSGFYRNIKFHRNIRNFMIQGGDPTGTGTGGESCFGKPFKDEIKNHLRHNARGILSMANSGIDTNGSQFFFTYRVCSNLDKKHTVFGKIISGNEVLKLMESIPSDKYERPTQDIILFDIIINIDPFEDYEKNSKDKDSKQKDKEETIRSRQEAEILALKAKPVNTGSTEIGKYMKPENDQEENEKKRLAADPFIHEHPTKRKNTNRGFNFDSW